MDTELELDLDKIESESEEKLKVKDRFAKLSEKVTLSNKERQEALDKAKAESEKSQTLARERDFYKEFSTTSGKYPNAIEHQDKIWEKVKLGYSTEDAVLSVLNAAGKLNAQSNQQMQQQSQQSQQTQNTQVNRGYGSQVAGGSSATNVSEGEKPLENMTIAEKFNALRDAERRGDISMN